MFHDIIDVYEADVFKWQKLITIEAWNGCECERCDNWHIVNDLDYDCIIRFDSETMSEPVLTIVTAWIGGNEHGEPFEVSEYGFSSVCHEPHDGWGNNKEIMSAFRSALDKLLECKDMQPVIELYQKEE